MQACCRTRSRVHGRPGSISCSQGLARSVLQKQCRSVSMLPGTNIVPAAGLSPHLHQGVLQHSVHSSHQTRPISRPPQSQHTAKYQWTVQLATCRRLSSFGTTPLPFNSGYCSAARHVLVLAGFAIDMLGTTSIWLGITFTCAHCNSAALILGTCEACL